MITTKSFVFCQDLFLVLMGFSCHGGTSLSFSCFRGEGWGVWGREREELPGEEIPQGENLTHHLPAVTLPLLLRRDNQILSTVLGTGGTTGNKTDACLSPELGSRKEPMRLLTTRKGPGGEC